MTDKPILVWGEVPVADMDRAVAFYNEVFAWNLKVDTSGPNPMAVFGDGNSRVAGHLYPGKPATGNGPTVHLAVPDTVEAACGRCTAAGGTVLSPAITIPAGRFAYALDPDGNSIGLFEAAA